MSSNPRKNRIAFRPTLGDIQLEERVVLNGTSMTSAAAAAEVSALQTGGGTTNGQASLENLTTRQIRQAFLQQFRGTQTALRQFVNSQASALFNDPANRGPNGRLTAEALANFGTNIAGGINAAALRLSAQTSLLPGSSRRLVPELQNALLGSRANSLNTRSLSSRIANLAGTGIANRSQAAFQNAINREINQSFTNSSARLTNFFNTTPLEPPVDRPDDWPASARSRSSWSTKRSPRPITASGPWPTVSGRTRQRPCSTRQARSIRRIWPASNSSSPMHWGRPPSKPVASSRSSRMRRQPWVRNSSPPSSAAASTPSPACRAPVSSTAFRACSPPERVREGPRRSLPTRSIQDSRTRSRTSFQNFTTPLNNFFGVTPTTGTGGTFTLPNGFFQTGSTFPSVFGSQFTGGTFNNGFNNGFATTGSGFPGFGTAPTGFNTGFGTGFNNFTNSLNQQFGFTQPTINTGIGTGIGRRASAPALVRASELAPPLVPRSAPTAQPTTL